jgi:hypothetical protein
VDDVKNRKLLRVERIFEGKEDTESRVDVKYGGPLKDLRF